jgi:hypothetical protein
MIQNSKVPAGSTIGKKYCVSLSENSGFSTFGHTDRRAYLLILSFFIFR